jgi:hypothetical protein
LPSNGKTPQSGGQQQLIWTRLPQGFKNSPTIFRTALASDLWAYPAEEAGCTLTICGCILLAAVNNQDCLKGTEFILHLLWESGYKYLERRLRSAKTHSNIWGFTSPKASRTLVQKENKLSLQS